MKYVILTAFILFGGVAIHAQAVKWDSTFRPGNYAERVANFRSYPDSKKDIVFLGNSITHYAEWTELLQLKNARNRGISGDISFGVLERLDEVTNGKPAKIFILVGINDIARNIPDTVLLMNYKRMISRIRTESPRTKIYFNALLPVNNSYTDKNHFNKDARIAFVNGELQKICTAEKITFINIHDAFLDSGKKLDKRYTYDGLHLNAEGYKLWAGLLRPYVKK